MLLTRNNIRYLKKITKKTVGLTTAILCATILSACNSDDSDQNELSVEELLQNAAVVSFSGNTIKHTWTEGAFAGAEFITFICDDNTLVWNQTRYPDAFGGGKITPPSTSKEQYAIADVYAGILQVSWRENGTNLGIQSVIWTLNFATNKIYGALVFEGDFGFGVDINDAPLDAEGNRQNFTVSGTFEVIEGISEPDDFGQCN